MTPTTEPLTQLLPTFAPFLPLVVVILLAIPFSIMANKSTGGKVIFCLFLAGIPFLMIALFMIQHHCALGSICNGHRIPSISISVK